MHRRTGIALLILLAGIVPPARAQAPPAPGDPVPAQTAIPRLSNFASLATIMNLARGTVRIVAIASPSSPDAEAGIEVVAAVLRGIPSKRLRAYVILSRAGDEDTEVRALAFASRHSDRRIVYVWDPEAVVAAAMAPLAAQVCLLYDTDATFTATPASPVLSLPMGPGTGGARLDEDRLRDTAESLVRSVERKASATPAQSQ